MAFWSNYGWVNEKYLELTQTGHSHFPQLLSRLIETWHLSNIIWEKKILSKMNWSKKYFQILIYQKKVLSKINWSKKYFQKLNLSKKFYQKISSQLKIPPMNKKNCQNKDHFKHKQFRKKYFRFWSTHF